MYNKSANSMTPLIYLDSDHNNLKQISTKEAYITYLKEQ